MHIYVVSSSLFSHYSIQVLTSSLPQALSMNPPLLSLLHICVALYCLLTYSNLIVVVVIGNTIKLLHPKPLYNFVICAQVMTHCGYVLPPNWLVWWRFSNRLGSALIFFVVFHYEICCILL